MSRDPFPTEPRTLRDSEERSPENRLGTNSLEPARSGVDEFRDRGSEFQHPIPRGDARKPEAAGSPRAYYFHDRTYFHRDSDVTTLIEIGTVRVGDTDDFVEFS